MKEEIRQPEQSNKFWFLNLEGQLELVENAPFGNINNSNVILDNKHLDYSCTLKEVKKEEVEVKVELYKPLKPSVTIKPLEPVGTAEIATAVQNLDNGLVLFDKLKQDPKLKLALEDNSGWLSNFHANEILEGRQLEHHIKDIKSIRGYISDFTHPALLQLRQRAGISYASLEQQGMAVLVLQHELSRSENARVTDTCILACQNKELANEISDVNWRVLQHQSQLEGTVNSIIEASFQDNGLRQEWFRHAANKIKALDNQVALIISNLELHR